MNYVARTDSRTISPAREMSPLSAILIICDRDTVFREGLHNFLLAAGYREIEIAVTVGEALKRLRRECYGHVLIGAAPAGSRGQRLASIARRRQPEAKIVLLVSDDDRPSMKDTSFEVVTKEHVFANLLGLM